MGQAKRNRDAGVPPRTPSLALAWRAYVLNCLPPGLSEAEIEARRLTFFAGASVVMYGMLRMLDPGDEPTDADLRRMEALYKEIEAFTVTFDEAVWRALGIRRH